jgi:hypothetical protein
MDRLVVNNAEIGVPEDKTVGDIDLEKALFKYLAGMKRQPTATPESKDLGMASEGRRMRGIKRRERMARLSEDSPDIAAPVAKDEKMRKSIVAMSLAPHVMTDKIKKVLM